MESRIYGVPAVDTLLGPYPHLIFSTLDCTQGSYVQLGKVWCKNSKKARRDACGTIRSGAN